MKRLIFIALILNGTLGFAQNEIDILRGSFHNSFSSARNAGMGGAFGALGADLSSINSNPAGLGLYRRSDFNITANLGGSNSKTSFNNANSSKSDVHFKINSLGFAVAQESDNLNVNQVVFAISLNQVANFNERFRVLGSNDNSILDVFADQVQGIDYFDIEDAPTFSQLAWNAYLIDTISGSTNQYSTAFLADKSNHDVLVERSGGISELSFGGAANIGDRFFWGASIGIPFLNFSEEITHRETPGSGLTQSLSSFTYTETLDVEGVGINLKAGVIIKPTQSLRIGAAIHTPTAYSVSDSYSRGILADFSGEVEQPDDFVGSFDYRLKTPLRLIANAAFIAGKSGIISADYQYVDYSTGKLKKSSLSGDSYNFESENEQARQSYRGTHNINAGVEIRFAKVYRVRVGAKYMQSPFEEGELTEGIDGPIISYTGGFGYRYDDFYLDIAAIYTEKDTSHYAYSSSYIDEAIVNRTQINILTSIGWRF